MCRLEEWDSMPNKFDNTWGIVKESGGPSFFLISISSTSISTYIFFFLFPAQVRPEIINEQESFIRRVLENPFE